MSQDCVEARQELEERLARIQLAYEEALANLAECQSGGGVSGTTTTASLGSVTALLALAYLGGVYWRRYFGPDGPEYPLDRLVHVSYSCYLLSCSILAHHFSYPGTVPDTNLLGGVSAGHLSVWIIQCA